LSPESLGKNSASDGSDIGANVSSVGIGMNSNYNLIVSDENFAISWNSSLWDLNYTTNFSSVNVSNFQARLRNAYGSILFLENVSASRNLDLSHVLLGRGFVYLNSSALSDFNLSANVSLFNLSFTNPYVLRDGVNCTSCLGLNYLNGTLNFSVVGFSNYSASESPNCSDGVQNGGETGVDCGGSCLACVAVEVEVVSSGGEGGGGGSDVVEDVIDAVTGVVENVLDVLNGNEEIEDKIEEEVAFGGDEKGSVSMYWVVGILIVVLAGAGIGFFVWKRKREIDRKVYENG
jgi:hypothetical protein